jgi:hypothetical protein
MNKLNDAFKARYRERQKALEAKLAEQRVSLANSLPKAAKPVSTCDGETASWLDSLPDSYFESKDEEVLSTKELSIKKYGFEIRFHGLDRDYGITRPLRHSPGKRQAIAINKDPTL